MSCFVIYVFSTFIFWFSLELCKTEQSLDQWTKHLNYHTTFAVCSSSCHCHTVRKFNETMTARSEQLRQMSKHRSTLTCVIVLTMVRLSAISQIFAKLNKNFICLNRRDCRYYSQGARAKSKEHMHSVIWSINGSNSPYSSVNATLHVSSTKVGFNCGEGLQRLMAEDMGNHLKIFQHIFITRLDWQCLAGLPGVLLTLSNRGAKHLNVYGPSTLNHLCERIMRNMPRQGFEVTIVDCANGHKCADTAFHIRAIPLPKRTEMNAKVIAYAGDIAAHRSRVHIDRCVDLNVTAAPFISQLAHGFDVTLDDGSVVRSADVTDFFPKLNFLGKMWTRKQIESDSMRINLFCISVVDIPNMDYFHHLESEELLLQEDEGENTVFHFAPPKVIATEEYQNYMRKFPAGTLHVATDEKFLWVHRRSRYSFSINEGKVHYVYFFM